MAENKFRYYTVETTTTVKARNKTEAQAIARGRRGVAGNVLAQETVVDRITANVAHSATATA